MKKSILLVMLFMLSSIASWAQMWLRNSEISPDGAKICFTYKGDIFTVDRNGGVAKQITTNSAYDSYPVWSPDGSKIVFASDRLGSLDVFVVESGGGVPQRITTHSGKEIPIEFKDNNTILFQAVMMPSKIDSQFPHHRFNQIYEVSINGGRPKMFSSMPLENITFTKNRDKFYYHDYKGYEDTFRKHHRSSITRDLWSADIKNGEIKNYTKLTSFNGEDRNPVLNSAQNTIYYISEQDNTMNIYEMDLLTKNSKQLTTYKNHPVRYLSISNNDILNYSWNGNLYTLDVTKSGAKPQKVDVQIIIDETQKDEVKKILTSGATQMSLSPSGKEIAFVLRGDIYVTAVDYKTTKQITNSANQERNVSFSPDGRSLVYAAEKDGLWQVYQTSLTKKEEKNFTYATAFKEERLTNSNIASFQPKYSPDGKEVAFLEDRTEIKVLNLETKKTTTVMDKKYEFSYTDGDQSYAWSPDSKWIVSGYSGDGGWNNGDIAIVKADGSGEIHNLTQSGYSDNKAKWVLGGEAIIWTSDRAGYRSHGSWGAYSDVYIMFLTLESFEKFNKSEEELSILEDEDKDDKKKDEEEEKEETIKSFEFDLVNAEDRIVRLTVNSSAISDAILTKDADKLYYLTRFEGGYDLWVNDLRKKNTKLLLKDVGAGELQADKSLKNIFLSSGGAIKKVDIESNKVTPVAFEALFTHRAKGERNYMFNHVWQQINDKFYVEDIHNVDWELYKENYEPMLEHINNNYDFAELLSEMLGELNASHTGAIYSAPAMALQTASLGVFVDENYKGKGLKIDEIINGSPLDIIKTNVKEGDVILKIDGVEITENMDYFPLLEGKAGKDMLLTISKTNSNQTIEQSIKPITDGALKNLLYKRWVKIKTNMVDSLSNGRLAYVHIKGMNSESYGVLYSELLGKFRNKEAVIVDTRHNGGGWLHDDVITLLNGKKYQDFVAHGQYIGRDPFNKWVKPSCMLMCENNYSNAHGTPWLFKEMKVGKLIGTPVPGTMTAVWWEKMLDPTMVFGVPQVGIVDNNGKYAENNELQPDILLYNSHEKSLKGKDEQLEKAVEHMLGIVD